MHDLFPARDLRAMYENLRRMGAGFGLNFVERARLSNSRLPLEASEFARETDKFDIFHSEVFRVYFTAGQDIGDLNVVLQLAEKCGMDVTLLADALKKGQYTKNLSVTQNKARELGIRSVPTFIINGQERITGSQPVEKFREVLKLMAGKATD